MAGPDRRTRLACFVCGRPQHRCEEMRVFEEANGVRDVHEFETADEAERNLERGQTRRATTQPTPAEEAP